MSFYVPPGWKERQWSTVDFDNDLVIQNNPWGAISGTHLDRPIPRDQWYQAVGVNDEGNPAAVFSYPREYFDPSKVIAYPEVVYGNKFGTLDSGAPEVPIRVGDIDQIDIELDYQMLPHPMRPSEKAVHNVAVETFFHSQLPIVGPGHPDHDRNNTQVAFELMVWLQAPESDEIGLGRSLGTVTDRYGSEWLLHSYADDYCAFLCKPGTPIPTKFCWSDFIAAVNARPELVNLNPNWYISAFEFGPEIWTGAGLFEWKKFLVDVRLKGATNPGTGNIWSHIAQAHRDLARLYDDVAAQ